MLSVIPDSLEAQEQQHPIVNSPEPSHPVVKSSQDLKVSAPASNPDVLHTSSMPEYDVVTDSLVCRSPSLPLLSDVGSAVKQGATANDVSMDKSASLSTRLISAEETSQPLASTDSLQHPTPQNYPSIKEENQELGLDMGTNASYSQSSGASSLGKRGRSRLGEFNFCDESAGYSIATHSHSVE